MKVQLCLVALVLSILRGTYSQQTPIEGGCSVESDGDLRLVHKQGDNFGALQVCDAGFGWRYFIDMDWTVGAARLACMQLGLPSLDPAFSTLSLSRVVFIRTVEGSCVETAQRLNNCIRNPFQTRNTVLTVNAKHCTANGDLPREECTTDPVDTNMAECTVGSLRLADGVRYREGRVEVCVDGRWGTVCSEGWTESDASQVCSRLGYPSTDAMIRYFGEGTGTVHNLVCQVDCRNQATGPSNCDHSKDVGVRCQSHSEACAAEINNETLSSLTTMPMEDNTVTVTWSTVLGLGAFAGLTAAALIAVIVSWIITCIYQQKFKVQLIEDTNEQQSPQTNAVYDYINENEAPPTVSCDLTSNEAYHSVQCVTNDSYSVVPQ